MSEWSALLIGVISASAFWVVVGGLLGWKLWSMAAQAWATEFAASMARQVLNQLDSGNEQRARRLLEVSIRAGTIAGKHFDDKLNAIVEKLP